MKFSIIRSKCKGLTSLSDDEVTTEPERIQQDEITPAAVLIAQCFRARTLAHFLHLRTNSQAHHLALNEFYLNIVTLTDAYAESYQGRYGIIQNYPFLPEPVGVTPISLVIELRSLIDTLRSQCGVEQDLQALIDDIVNQCNSTIYKLSNLK